MGNGRLDALDEAQIARIAALEAEVVIIGTGARQQIPSPAVIWRPPISARTASRSMDLGSACRTCTISCRRRAPLPRR